jgi:hypothetical protein
MQLTKAGLSYRAKKELGFAGEIREKISMTGECAAMKTITV